ncbi:hypothetical protein ZIOFF_067153 [Zingiber officinale]|uniref:40S ribosomal protein S7 n=1 Tax=Zingiber officinale TaxID=94328 RepID=A0A8J5ESL5_ZINOF|nr:hypothetical protein ZIOFF_067153 [Zingiber officinale]
MTPSASYRPSPPATAVDSPSSSSIGKEIWHLTIAEPTKEQTPQPAAPPASSKGLRHPARLDFGTVGRPCLVRANHFLVEIVDNTLFHYDCPELPIEKSSLSLSRCIRIKPLGRRMPAYDGRKSLYMAGTFPFESKEFTVSLPENDGRKAKDFRVIIKLAGNTSIHNLKEFLAGRQIEAPQEAFFDLENANQELKSDLKDLYINSAVQIDMPGNRKAVVIHIPYRLRKAYKKIHVRLVRELEKKFSGKAFEKHRLEKGIAEYIKEFRSKYGQT